MIREAPVNMSVKAGSIAAFRCVAVGDPTPHITWRINGDKVTSGNTRFVIASIRHHHVFLQQRIVVHDGKALAVLTVFVKRTLMKLQRWIFRDQIDYALYGKFVPN